MRILVTETEKLGNKAEKLRKLKTEVKSSLVTHKQQEHKMIMKVSVVKVRRKASQHRLSLKAIASEMVTTSLKAPPPAFTTVAT